MRLPDGGFESQAPWSNLYGGAEEGEMRCPCDEA